MTYRWLLFISACSFVSLINAVVTPIRTLDRFNRSIINEPLVVAYLYQREPLTKCRKQTIAKNNAVLKAISRDDRYQAAGISFVTANLSRGCLGTLTDTYQLTDQDTLLLFNRERRAATELTGTFNRAEVEECIESHWSDTIDTIIKQQTEERKQRLAEMKARYAYWGTGPYGGYWPCGWGADCGWGGYGYGGCGPGNGYLSIAGGWSW